jgi:hypothetical protein
MVVPPVKRRRVLIADIPESVLSALAQDQPQRPINDLCSEILAARYGIPFESINRNGRNWRRAHSLVLKLPEPVWAAMKQEATPYSTIKQVAIQAFIDHYKL